MTSPAIAEEANTGSTNVMEGPLGVDGAAVDIDERTGNITTAFPIAHLNGAGGTGTADLTASYTQHTAPENGLGNGWSWALTRVDLSNGTPRIYPATGGMYDADTSTTTGLARYPQENLHFTQTPGTLTTPRNTNNAGSTNTQPQDHENQDTHKNPENNGTQTLKYWFVLETLGGMKEYFSPTGFLIARVDAFGNTTQWEWDETTNQLLSITDTIGNTITLEWTDTNIRVHTPTRADHLTPPPVVIETHTEGITAITTPTNETTRFTYTTGRLSEISSPTGAVTRVHYQEPQNNVTPVTVTLHDDNGTQLSHTSWEPLGENTHTGLPTHTGGENALWSSGDGAYRYHTRITDGHTHIDSTYNSMGLLTNRALLVSTHTETLTVREEHATYPGTHNNGVPPRDTVPANYALPTETTTVFRDRDHSRTITEHTQWDTFGRQVSHTDPHGTTTTTRYDNTTDTGSTLPIGLATEQTTTGTDGTVSTTVNTLTPDRKSIQHTETLTGMTDRELASTTRTSFTTNPDGFVTKQTITTSPNAHVANGPEHVTTRFTRTINPDTQTLTLTETRAADTSAETTISTTSDLSTGLPLHATDATGRVSSTSYDEAGRQLTTTSPTGLVTTTSYDNHGYTTRTHTPNGITTSTYRDALGRVTKTTTNTTTAPDGSPTVSNDPGFERTLETRVYDQNGSRISITNALGHVTTTRTDVFGRPLTVSQENGLTQVNEYDDVANTITTGITPKPEQGLTGALHTTTRHLDDTGRETKNTGTRADSVPVPDTTTVFDGLGRTTESTTNDLTTRFQFNPNGTPHTTTTTPTNPELFPGDTNTTRRTHDLTGTPTNKTFTRTPADTEPGNGTRSNPTTRSHDHGEGITRVMDAAGHVTSVTDQTGGVTRFTYTPDGLVTESIEETSSTVTRTSYDPATRTPVESVTTRPGSETIRQGFEHDPVTGARITVFDPQARETTQVTYTYDILGNPTSTTYPDGNTLSHTFDIHGRKTASIDITGNTTRYNYTPLGLVEKATQTRPDGDVLASVSYGYDTLGRIEHITRGNGLTTSYTFTSANEIATETTTNHHGNTLFTGRYNYDTHGNLTQKTTTQQHDTVVTELNDNQHDAVETETVTYRYNARNQLIESNVYPGNEPTRTPLKHTRYEIDVTGNITQETVTTATIAINNDSQDVSASIDGPVTETRVRAFDHNPLGHTTAITTNGHRVEQAYDTAGNLVTAADGTLYTYNALNQPVTQTGPDGVMSTHTYWATGKPSTTTQPPAPTRFENTATQPGSASRSHGITGFYWADNTLTNEVITPDNSNESQNSNPTISSYLFGTSRAAVTIENTVLTGTDNELGVDGHHESGNLTSEPVTEYYVNDRHGNVTALTDTAGTPTVSYTYTDYGRTTTHTNEHVTDDTNAEKTFVSAFSNRFQYAGEYTNPHGTQSLGERTYTPAGFGFTTRDRAPLYNRYAYANANPITRIDPTGQTAEDDRIITGVTLGTAILELALAVVTIDPLSATTAITSIANHTDSPSRASESSVSSTGLVFAGLAATVLTLTIGVAVAPTIRGLALGRFVRPIDDDTAKLMLQNSRDSIVRGLQQANRELDNFRNYKRLVKKANLHTKIRLLTADIDATNAFGYGLIDDYNRLTSYMKTFIDAFSTNVTAFSAAITRTKNALTNLQKMRASANDLIASVGDRDWAAPYVTRIDNAIACIAPAEAGTLALLEKGQRRLKFGREYTLPTLENVYQRILDVPARLARGSSSYSNHSSDDAY